MLLKIFAGLSLPLSVLLFMQISAPLWVLPLLYIGCMVGFLLLAFGFLCLMCVPVDVTKPLPHEDSRFYRKMVYLYIELIIQVLGAKFTTSGLERIPKNRRFLLVCNHQSQVDPAIIMHFLKKSDLAFICKKEVLHMPIAGQYTYKILCQYVNRENDREGLKTILRCIQLIKEDKVSIGVFPEGGMYLVDKLNPFRPGVFKIAQRAKVPIVVCTLKNTSQILHQIKHLKKIHAQLHLVDIIPDWQVAEMTTAEISERVYNLMLEDLGEEYRL